MVALVLFVEEIVELKVAEYDAPEYGESPVTPAELNRRFWVNEPLLAPPIIEATGVVALS